MKFRKNFTGPSFCGRWAKKLLLDISFDNDFQKNVLSNLLLFSCACYLVGLDDDIQWNKVETSAGRNFNSSWLLYLHFSNRINLCPNIWFIKNSKCQKIVTLKKEPSKKHNFLIFLRGRFFYVNVGLFWKTSAGFVKSVVLQLFPKYNRFCWFEYQE